MFVTLMVVGLVGLVLMILPGFGHKGGLHHGAGHSLGHGGAAHAPLHLPAHAAPHGADAANPGALAAASDSALAQPSQPTHASLTRFLPSPRAVFSVMALVGAFGNALVAAAHLSQRGAAVVALALALVLERVALRPLFNLVFRFQGAPASPMGALLHAEARAVTAFRNGRGLVSVVRDGRMVQLTARLRPDQSALPVNVGDKLRVEDLDGEGERVVVSLFGR